MKKRVRCKFLIVEMAIKYEKVAKTPYVFRQLTGLTIEEFQKVVKKVRSEWEETEEMLRKKATC